MPTSSPRPIVVLMAGSLGPMQADELRGVLGHEVRGKSSKDLRCLQDSRTRPGIHLCPQKLQVPSYVTLPAFQRDLQAAAAEPSVWKLPNEPELNAAFVVGFAIPPATATYGLNTEQVCGQATQRIYASCFGDGTAASFRLSRLHRRACRPSRCSASWGPRATTDLRGTATWLPPLSTWDA